MERRRDIIIMGVSGAGKSTVGRLVAERLGLPFIEGDDFHPPENVAKMRRGEPLENTDRRAWISALGKAVLSQSPAVASCSALNETVRRWLVEALQSDPKFVYLHVPYKVLAKRLSERSEHFFDPALLDSQLDALSVPENAIIVEANAPLSDVVGRALQALHSGSLDEDR